jgi:hypothetical protein
MNERIPADERFVNIDPNTLEVTFASESKLGMVISVRQPTGVFCDKPSPMWDLVYSHFMYGGWYRHQTIFRAHGALRHCFARLLGWLQPHPRWCMSPAGATRKQSSRISKPFPTHGDVMETPNGSLNSVRPEIAERVYGPDRC